MQEKTTKAFVLDSRPHKEQDKIVTLLKESGKIQYAYAPGALKKRNRFGSVLELLTLGEFEFSEKENREFITLSKSEIVESHFNTFHENPDIFYFYLIAETLIKLVRPGSSDQRLFRLLLSVMRASRAKADTKAVTAYFIIWLLRIEGIMFTPSLCYNCSKTGLRESWIKSDFNGTLCSECRSDEKLRLSVSDIDFILWTKNNSPENKELTEVFRASDSIIRPVLLKAEHHIEGTFKTRRMIPEFR